ncbi:TetR family transcriptional regulator C-terminal domain-containing protein [Rhodoligotrophos defluvii]|uniref:TetR family transcriptional regulator C-terminal domain-containing protein n=1 Tax=Rhodoligotrophos defluvii TaxID=2561934 RepID=UPI0023B20B19|nr:TetR family transcriptional regulator C-terminal domain-containing protein [Rhodoligotrophos defluvii]
MRHVSAGAATQNARRTYSREDPQVRRQELIEATFRCLGKHGHARTSVRVIAAEAGVSPGLIRHHFGEKKQLISATYRYASDLLFNHIKNAVDAAQGDDWAKLVTFIEAGFTPPILSKDYITVRFVLWGVAMTDPVIRQVHSEVNQRYRRLMSRLLSDVVGNRMSDQEVKSVTAALAALQNGLWLDWSLNPRQATPADLRETALQLVRQHVSPPSH